MRIRDRILWAGLLAGGVAVGAWPADGPPARAALLTAPAPEGTLDGRLALARVEATDAGERAVVDLHVDSRLRGAPRGLYVLELVDDRGRAQVVPLEKRLPAARASARDTFRVSWRLPALADGYHLARATVAVVSDEDESGFQQPLYLHARDGQVEVIDAEEFFMESRAGEGVVVGARGGRR